jgi:threonine synthase
MRFRSTRTEPGTASLAEALTLGLAPDGGLYVPADDLRPLPAETLATLRAEAREHVQVHGDPEGVHFPVARTGSVVLRHLLGGPGGPSAETLDRIAQEALNFPIPLVTLPNGIQVLELFHGPTLAFKDVGARVMARLLAEVTREEHPPLPHRSPLGSGSPIPQTPLTILAATSGDTGGAVASAFFGVPGTRVVVLYPEGQVSPRQEAQFTTLGGNTLALRVRGTFDDCQRMVKEAFADPDLRATHRLTSANSINVGRLLPQVIYHVHAWVLAGATRAATEQDPPLFVAVPSGNFGNLAAGLLAQALGVPIHRFVAATNANDVVPEYLASGTYTPRPPVRTHSSAMDVGAPSNVERIRALFGDDLTRIREAVTASAWSDEETEEILRRVDREFGYVMDPHTAVGFLALEKAQKEGANSDVGMGSKETRTRPTQGIVLATAHPAKFAEIVEPVLGRSLPLPAPLADRLGAPREFMPVGPTLRDLEWALATLEGRSSAPRTAL